MPNLIPAIESRRARRALDEAVIPREVIQRVMKAATYAPSCFNHQPWRFLVATAPQALEKIRPALTDGNYWAKKAHCLVAVITRVDLDCQSSDRRDYAFYDCGLAAENLILQAVAEGLYAHPMAGYDPDIIRVAFNIPEDYIIINLIALGYPGDQSHLSDKHRQAETNERPRMPLEKVICYDGWTLS